MVFFSKILGNENEIKLKDSVFIEYLPTYNYSKIKVNSYELYMNKENPDEIIFHGCDGSTMKTGGTYNIKTGEINGGYYKIDDRIKNIISELLDNKKPQNIDKMYEEYSSVIEKIQKELETPEKLNIIRSEQEFSDDELWHL